VGASQIIQLAGDFGPMGLFVGYLVWAQMRREKLDKDRIDADKALATSLALLEQAVRGRR
jgi:hypothetical protein